MIQFSLSLNFFTIKGACWNSQSIVWAFQIVKACCRWTWRARLRRVDLQNFCISCVWHQLCVLPGWGQWFTTMWTNDRIPVNPNLMWFCIFSPHEPTTHHPGVFLGETMSYLNGTATSSSSESLKGISGAKFHLPPSIQEIRKISVKGTARIKKLSVFKLSCWKWVSYLLFAIILKSDLPLLSVSAVVTSLENFCNYSQISVTLHEERSKDIFQLLWSLCYHNFLFLNCNILRSLCTVFWMNVCCLFWFWGQLNNQSETLFLSGD